MSADPREDPGTLPLELADRIDRVCDRFEAALASGQRPRIEDYLEGVDATGRSALLRELLASELEWRRRRGEQPSPGEYQERFPSDASLIGAAFETQPAADNRPTVRRRPYEPHDAGGEGDESLRPGARPLPGYRLIERLGRGGFGEVWKAEAPGGASRWL